MGRVENQDSIVMQSIKTVSDHDIFDNTRAQAINRMKDFVTSFAVYDESRKDKAMCQTLVSLKI